MVTFGLNSTHFRGLAQDVAQCYPAFLDADNHLPRKEIPWTLVQPRELWRRVSW
jgi:hypothetical protein